MKEYIVKYSLLSLLEIWSDYLENIDVYSLMLGLLLFPSRNNNAWTRS
jgi:hypothetical protein